MLLRKNKHTMAHSLNFDITEISLKSYLIKYAPVIEDCIVQLSIICSLVLPKMSLNYEN